MSLKDFQILNKLGEGAYSTVFKVRRIEDGLVYALKRVKLGTLSSKERQNALNEIRILASVNHPNVVGYKQAFIDQPSKSLCIVMEFAINGDLAAKIAQHIKQGTNFPQPAIWLMFGQLVRGLRQLHQLHIFHRDIKTANVFLSENDIAKLGDMNVSKVSQEGLCITQTGTPYYASPEVWKDQPYNQKSDIWSLGCVLYEMICLKVPFKAQDMEGLYKKVTRGIYPRLPNQYSQDLSTLIRTLLQTNPQQRPSCDKILKMPTMIKHIGQCGQEVKGQLLRTIKAENFHTISQSLPRSNYQQAKKKTRMIKGAESLQQITRHQQIESICEIQSLPILQKDKKIYAIENSDRVMSKDKLNVHFVNRDRKKSQIGYSRSGLDVKGQASKLDEIRQLKLPKVQNRYNRNKEKTTKIINNQNSLRCYKIFEC